MNQHLLEQNEELKEQIKSLQNQLDSVSQILHEKLKQERLIEEHRMCRKNRRLLPKRFLSS
jgi:cell division septum initiation protein DivIVA